LTESPVAFAAAAQRSWPETILLVEDEAFVRNATAEVLESAGYRLVIAASAAEALDAYRKCVGRVDLLLADVVMPGMSGSELAAEFERLCPRARVLLMSGRDEQVAGPARSCDGKNLWNGKPNPVTLVATVLARKSAVQPSSRFPVSRPYRTTSPEPIPTRLITTCTNV